MPRAAGQRRRVWCSRAWVLCTIGLVITACSGGRPGGTPGTVVSTHPITVRPSQAATGPLDTRPTAAVDARACPFLDSQTVADTVGMRLGRVEVLRQGGKTIGCRFYALQGSPLSTSEHLPGPNQPVVEIASTVYATVTAAHNALARLATAGTDPQQRTITAGIVGVVFRTGFDPADGARDWTAAFNKASTLVVTRTAVTDTSEDALEIAQALAAKF